MPIFANRPAPRIAGNRNFWIPSGKNTTRPTSSRTRIDQPGARVAKSAVRQSTFFARFIYPLVAMDKFPGGRNIILALSIVETRYRFAIQYTHLMREDRRPERTSGMNFGARS